MTANDTRSMKPDRLETPLGILLLLLAALLAGGFGALLVSPLGLSVSERVVWPLSLAFGGLLGTVGASWVSWLLAGRRSRTRIAPAALLAAAVGAALGAFEPELRDTPLLPNLASAIVVHVLALSLVVAAAVVRLRSAPRHIMLDAALSAGLVAGGLLAIAATVTVTCTLGYCGA